MPERRAILSVAAAVMVSVLAHVASAQSGRSDRGSESAEHGRDGDVSIIDRDRADAQRAIFRCDENRDGIIDRDEAGRGHWSSDPFAFDFNGDGRLTESELAVRYARRRMDRPSTSPAGKRVQYQGEGDRATGTEPSPSDPKTDSQASTVQTYRSREAYERLFGDLPSWFKERDADLDGQVMMSEYASEWTNELAEQFSRLDPNGDGVITAKEGKNARTLGDIAESTLSRIVAQPSAAPSSSDEADSSEGSEATEASDEVAQEGPLTPEQEQAKARDARRQLWGKLYSSKRPAPPKDDPKD